MSHPSSPDPLYHPARSHFLHSNDPSLARLQRCLRIGHHHAQALRDSLRGDAVDCQADTGHWRIRPQADRHTDFALEDKLARAAALIQSASALVIAAGAGMAVDSGLPCLHSDEDLWQAYPALRPTGLRLGQAASPRLFVDAPATAWGFHGLQLLRCRSAQPHAGFARLRDWVQRMPLGAFVCTSQADGHFLKTGFAQARILECHGSRHRLQCTANCRGALWHSADLQPQVDGATGQWLGALPRCPDCGAPARPNVQMQDDWQWNGTRSAQQRLLFDLWLDSTPDPLVLEIGAGTTVPTLRNLTRRLQARGSRWIRINLHEADIHAPQGLEIALGAREALERIQQHMAPARASPDQHLKIDS